MKFRETCSESGTDVFSLPLSVTLKSGRTTSSNLLCENGRHVRLNVQERESDAAPIPEHDKE